MQSPVEQHAEWLGLLRPEGPFLALPVLTAALPQGLDQAVGNGVSIYRAVKSQPWPGTASLEVSLLWVGHTPDDEPRTLDGRQVQAITPSLDPRSRISGNPHRLAANADQSFQGSNILGLGFTMTPNAAQELISNDVRNRDVLFPYLIGEDLNSCPDCSASRWVINFQDWPIEQAQKYEHCFALVEEKVKPERAKKKILGGAISGGASLGQRRSCMEPSPSLTGYSSSQE